MILRIFATDGFTPERVFRWSVDQTAEHLCEKQVLWVTRLDGPYKPLVDWFVKHPSFRGVVLDPADRWEWNAEHEITWRIAQGLYFKEGKHQEQPEAVCWIHDDMAPPESKEFKNYLRGWLASGHSAMAATCYQLWDEFDAVRVDEVGFNFAADQHCWLAKWEPDLMWMEPTPTSVAVRFTNRTGFVPTFTPSSAASWQVSPWPFRHAKGVDRSFRVHTGFVRRGFPPDRWENAEMARCVTYNPQMTWEEFKATVKV